MLSWSNRSVCLAHCIACWGEGMTFQHEREPARISRVANWITGYCFLLIIVICEKAVQRNCHCYSKRSVSSRLPVLRQSKIWSLLILHQSEIKHIKVFFCANINSIVRVASSISFQISMITSYLCNHVNKYLIFCQGNRLCFPKHINNLSDISV